MSQERADSACGAGVSVQAGAPVAVLGGVVAVRFAWVDAERDRDLGLPSYATAGSAGVDLRAAVPADRPLLLPPGGRALVPTGLQLALPAGFEGQVRPRSGLAARFGVTVLNAPGTIDSDYRGELQILLINHGEHEFTILRGERVAQLIVAPIVQVRWVEEATLDATDRGAGGFGHTGR